MPPKTRMCAAKEPCVKWEIRRVVKMTNRARVVCEIRNRA